MLHIYAVLKLARNGLIHGLKIYNFCCFTAFNRYVRTRMGFISTFCIRNCNLRSIFSTKYTIQNSISTKNSVFTMFLSPFLFSFYAYMYSFVRFKLMNQWRHTVLKKKNTTKENKAEQSKAKHSSTALIRTALNCGKHWTHSSAWTVNLFVGFVYHWNQITGTSLAWLGTKKLLFFYFEQHFIAFFIN